MQGADIRSGNAVIDALFDACVQILLWLADMFNVSYNTINIWIFCVIWPIITLTLIVVVVRQHAKIRKLKKRLRSKPGGAQQDDKQVGNTG